MIDSLKTLNAINDKLDLILGGNSIPREKSKEFKEGFIWDENEKCFFESDDLFRKRYESEIWNKT